MRFTRTSEDRAAIERAGTALQALLDEGRREVPIEKVLGWLGYRPVSPAEARPAGPAPGTDPMTGCLPVTPPDAA